MPSLASKYASRFNAIEYEEGRALEVMQFYDELDGVSTWDADMSVPDFKDYENVKHPVFTMFADGHLLGVYSFDDGSKMRIAWDEEAGKRKALVL